MTSFADVIRAEARSLELQHAAEEEREIELTKAEKWARDPLGWISANVWIASPFHDAGDADYASFDYWLRVKRRLRPMRFHPYPGQVATARGWLDLDHLGRTGELVFRNVIIEKSRQIGETWIFAALVCWALHYHDVTGLAMHEKGAKIDDGGARNTVESLFGKIRYIDQRLGSTNGSPLTADRRRVAGVARPLVFRPFSRDPAKVENPVRGSVVIGEGQTDNPGRGSTFDFALGDEFAFVQHSGRVHSALDEACPTGKAYLSTVNGDGNEHARIADEKPEGWTYLRLHWSEHAVYSTGLHTAGDAADCVLCAGNRAGLRWESNSPKAHRYPGRPTSPWYDWRVVGKTDEQVANELDIDRARALAGRVYSEFTMDVHVEPGGIEYDPNLPLELAWDFGLDATAIPVCQDAPNEYRVIGLVEVGDLFGTTATPELVSAALVDYLADLGVGPVALQRKFTSAIHCVGDPAGQSRSLDTGLPFVAAYRRLGWVIRRPPSRYTKHASSSISSVKRLLGGTPKPLRVCGVNASVFAERMRNNTWPVDSSGKRQLGVTIPRDDIHNHACLVAGTFVTTAHGDIPIEAVSPGDYVLTRHGFRPVRAAFSSGFKPVFEIETAAGAALVGTADHPVWVEGSGWRPLGALDYAASLLMLTESETPTNVPDANGRVRMGRFRQVTTSITSTETRSTTISRTSRASRLMSIWRATAATTRQRVVALAGMRDPVSRLASPDGPLQMMVGQRLARLLGQVSPLAFRAITRAGTAAVSTRATGLSGPASALSPVDLPHDVRQASMMKSGSANSATRSSKPTATKSSAPALEAVGLTSPPRLVGEHEVFNLTVEDTEEFFANGILVHNCRAFAYLIVSKWPPPKGGIDNTGPPLEPDPPDAPPVPRRAARQVRLVGDRETSVFPGMVG